MRYHVQYIDGNPQFASITGQPATNLKFEEFDREDRLGDWLRQVLRNPLIRNIVVLDNKRPISPDEFNRIRDGKARSAVQRGP
jgi:hypothetical protein